MKQNAPGSNGSGSRGKIVLLGKASLPETVDTAQAPHDPTESSTTDRELKLTRTGRTE